MPEGKKGRKYFVANRKERQTLTYTPHFLLKYKTRLMKRSNITENRLVKNNRRKEKIN